MRSFRATPTRRSRSCGNTSRASSKPSARFCRREIVRVFYATDLHGSEMCWRKFLNAAKFYDADVLICGGDMTGKAIVPIVEENGHFALTMAGQAQTVGPGQVGEVEAQIRRKGYYPLRVTPERLHELDGD